MWFSLISTASWRPMRWLRPPPAATAAFSSDRSPGVVLRVSRIAVPVPATACTKRAVSVATPERWESRLSPVRSAASSARAGPLTTATSTGTESRHSLRWDKLTLREQGHRRGEAVEEVAASDRPDLPGAEESAGRDAEGILDRRGVVVGHLEHMQAAAVAGEQQDAGRPRRAERLELGAERRAQVLVGGGA